MKKQIVRVLVVFAAVFLLFTGIAAATDVRAEVNVSEDALSGLTYESDKSVMSDPANIIQNFTTSEDSVSFTLNGSYIGSTADTYVLSFASGAIGGASTKNISSTSNIASVSVGDFSGYRNLNDCSVTYNHVTNAFIITQYGDTQVTPLINLVNITVNTTGIDPDDTGTVTIPWEAVSGDPNNPSGYVVSNGILTVNIKKESSLTLISYNGYYLNTSGLPILNATGANVTDVLTGEELWIAGANTSKRFNGSIAAAMVYTCSKGASKNGVIKKVTEYPVFYSASEANLTLNQSVVVSAYQKDGTLLASSTTANITGGKLLHDCTLSDQASYLTITFSGRKLGDVNNDGSVLIDDATAISKYCVPNGTSTVEEKFYADTDQNGKMNMGDAACISQFVIPLKPNAWM